MGLGNPNSRRTSVIILTVSIVLLGLGFLIGRATAPDSADPTNESEGQGQVDVGPTDIENGVPVGFARSEVGAVAAASAFSRVMTASTGDLPAYERSMLTLAAPDWADEAERLAKNGHDFFVDRYGTEGQATFAPLRYRVSSYSDDTASIDLWGVLAASGPSQEGIEESWFVGSIELIWTGDDWRVNGQSSQPGPTPELLSSEQGLNAEVLEEFVEFQGAPQP